MLQSKSKMAYFSEIPGLVLKLALGIMVLFLVIVIWRGVDQEGYVFQAFQVPTELEEKGLTGIVLSNRLMDQLVELKGKGNSSRSDTLNISVDAKPDLNIELMGVGLSSGTMSYHMRDVLGIKSNFIHGELIDIDNELILTLRMSGFDKEVFSKHYVDGKLNVTLNQLLLDASISILKKLDPYKLAIFYLRENDFEKAEEIIRFMIAEKPSDKKWAYYLWAYIKNMREERDRAMDFYNIALEEDPNFKEALRSRAWLHFQQTDFDKAKEDFDKFQDQDSKNFGVNNGLALTNWRQGKTEEAEKYYQNNIDRNPGNLWSYSNYSRFLTAGKKDTTAATQLWRKAQDNLKEGADYFMALSSFYDLKGSADSSLIFIDRALEYDPNNVPALGKYVNYHFTVSEDYEKCIVSAKKLRPLLKKGFDIGMQQNNLNLLSMSEYKVGQVDSAYIHINEAIDLYPSNPIPWTTLAEVYSVKGEHDKFITTITKAVDLGFDVSWVVEEEIYRDYKNHPKFIELLNRPKLKN